MSRQSLKVGIVAGESSGDLLGASLMHAITNQVSNVEFYGVGGDSMIAAGLHSLVDIEQFAVNGFVDPLLRAPSLLRALRLLIQRLTTMDVVVGVDFNVFNLLMERGLRKRGVPTAHYVSPSVYAWRKGRVKTIKKAADVVMVLFPFETKIYHDLGVRAEFVGHPTADRFDPEVTKCALKQQAKSELRLPHDKVIVSLMPGSRGSEIKFHFELFLSAAQLFQSRSNDCDTLFVVPSGHPSVKAAWQARQHEFKTLDLHITDADATKVLAASDLALVKSGTSTLEAMLMKTPMVVVYRLGALTAYVIRKLMYIEQVALPNILAQKELVPEFLQDAATPEVLAAALVEQHRRDTERLMVEFADLHRTLKRNAAERAAETVLSLVS